MQNHAASLWIPGKKILHRILEEIPALPELGTESMIVITLHYVLALLHNPLVILKKFIASMILALTNMKSLSFLFVTAQGTKGCYCSGQKTPDSSWGRPSEALSCWGSGNLEGGGRGEGWHRGGQFTSNLRPRWTDPVTARRVPSK